MKKILIVDDNEKNLKLFDVIIRTLGHEVITAVNGAEGVATAEKYLPHLILMDIQMPVMDGVTALRALKSREQTKDIPVVALTSYAMKGDRERFINEGFTDYISKPIEKDILLEVVNNAIGDRHD